MASRVVEGRTPDVEEFLRRRGPFAYASLVGLRVFEAQKLQAAMERGFKYQSFARLKANLELPDEGLAELIQLSQRTLARRRDEGTFSREESDRLLRAARVFGQALMAFDGDLAAARSWLSTPAYGLNGKIPRELASTEFGALQVEELLGQLQHGVFP